MKTMFQFLPKLMFCLGISCALSVGMNRADSYDEEAKQLLDGSGIQGNRSETR